MFTDRLMTPQETAAYLRKPTTTLAQWRSRRTGPPYIKLQGREIRYRLADLNRWLEQNTVTAEPVTP